ncbi:hypothetical protein [Streptomyces sp. NPDC046385]|uniref:hypothetical protein n=1 Tax=Streptomyces sp. NPDC046385 TaxID=3154918 RepID=UPI0033FD24DC
MADSTSRRRVTRFVDMGHPSGRDAECIRDTPNGLTPQKARGLPHTRYSPSKHRQKGCPAESNSAWTFSCGWESETEPKRFTNRWGGTSPQGSRDLCTCSDQSTPHPRARVGFHAERQDTSAPGWRHLLHLIDEAAADRREEFRPLIELPPEERRQIITLPPSIAKLTAVRHLVLYGSNLVRIPPEIGAMTSLEEFTPYTSYRLHWLPYEITRCRKLTRSTVSTRALFGNHKLRAPFPKPRPAPASVADLDPGDLDARRWEATAIRNCSVCDGPIEHGELHPVWISLRVATDVLPLLANACSPACVAALPCRAAPTNRTPPTGPGRQPDAPTHSPDGQGTAPADTRPPHPPARRPPDRHPPLPGMVAWPHQKPTRNTRHDRPTWSRAARPVALNGELIPRRAVGRVDNKRSGALLSTLPIAGAGEAGA